MLYNILIAPIQLILEFFYTLIYTITDSKGISVISLSFIVTIVTLPLYIIAEAWQQKERDIQNKLKPSVDRIKKAFSGDERYMMMNILYKQNHYHPIMALRSSFSLLIQIPFFIAAYNFLSSLEPLKGYSFLFIKDFGSPDKTFIFNNIPINILPIAMTVINCVAGFIYSKGHNKGEQIQIYACALVFLLLLYNSPSGLVVYWTMNNIFSLVKNIFYKIKNPRKVIYYICCAAGLLLLFATFTTHKEIKAIYKCFITLIAIGIPLTPLILKGLEIFYNKNIRTLEEHGKTSFCIFMLSSLTMVLIAGITIPSILIESETELYCYIDNYTTPLYFILVTFAKALGLFFLWPICFYFLFPNKTKSSIVFIFSNIALCSIINTFCFSGNYGAIEVTLLFMEPQHFFPTIKLFAFNLLSIFLVFSLTTIAIKKLPKILNYILGLCVFSLIFISTVNISSISKTYSKIPAPVQKDTIDPVFHLSKTKRNVLFIMTDASLTTLIQEVFNDAPAVKKMFDGFTYFPNTVSLGRVTMLGSPGLYGGYDYTPHEMAKVPEKNLQQKHNEALLTIPVLLNKYGFDTTVSDLPYENYLEQPISDMYKDAPYIKRVYTHGNYSKLWYRRHGMQSYPQTSFKIKRNFICFSIFKMTPNFLREIVYSHEYWLPFDPYDDARFFVDNFSELEFLPELFDFTNEKPSYIVIDNETWHNYNLRTSESFPCNGDTILKDNLKFKIHLAASYKLGQFFNYLRDNGVYDNTRIVIVSDHGNNPGNEEFLNKMPRSQLTATLLFKDFNSTAPLKTDTNFMTNADAPYLATKDISSAVNPFTNKSLLVKNKADYLFIADPPRTESTRNRKNYKFLIYDDEYWTLTPSQDGSYNIYDNSTWMHAGGNSNE